MSAPDSPSPKPGLNRRAFLIRTAALGCSAAASPLLTPVSFASAPWDNRLVVLILRGAMDGLDVLRPVGDPAFAALRPDRVGAQAGGITLDGFFELHPDLADLLPLWQVGELGFVNAVSTPYRDKRSHFDGQDILEAGTMTSDHIKDGWLNRMLQTIPGIQAETTYMIGRTEMLLTTGKAPVANWSPDSGLSISPQTEQLMRMVAKSDPLFRESLQDALLFSGLTEANGDTPQMTYEDDMSASDAARRKLRLSNKSARQSGGYDALAAFAAEKLKGDSRIATFSINGWDSHINQQAAMRRPLHDLQGVITTLKQQLGPVWHSTGVIAMTEFGRTVWINGTKGTDHGTGGTMLFAGGALRGGRALGDWPGLSEADLYQRRDLMPTSDVRNHAAFVMQGLFGLDRNTLQDAVFPGLDMSATSPLIL